MVSYMLSGIYRPKDTGDLKNGSVELIMESALAEGPKFKIDIKVKK